VHKFATLDRQGGAKLWAESPLETARDRLSLFRRASERLTNSILVSESPGGFATLATQSRYIWFFSKKEQQKERGNPLFCFLFWLF